MRRSSAVLLAVAIVVVAALPAFASVAAQEKPSTGSLADVTGTWVMQIEGHQIALDLEQKETKVEGIMHAMGRRILLVGDYIERKLTLKGERPEDGIAHGGDAGPIVATMLDDGTLEGELSTNRGRTKWTGDRFRKP
jgi:hypothetical protein